MENKLVETRINIALALLAVIILLISFILLSKPKDSRKIDADSIPRTGIAADTSNALQIFDPKTGKPIPIEPCGSECETFTSGIKNLSIQTIQLINTERKTGSGYCCVAAGSVHYLADGTVFPTNFSEFCCYSSKPEEGSCEVDWKAKWNFNGNVGERGFDANKDGRTCGAAYQIKKYFKPTPK